MKAQILIIIIIILALIYISITSPRVPKYLYNIYQIKNKQHNTILNIEHEIRKQWQG